MRRFQRGMIYLSTGANGSCKTLFTLKDVRELQLKDLRPVYYVEGRFKPTAVLTEEFGWKPFKFADWQSLPDGAIIFCDEVHNDLPKRATNSPVPAHVSKLAEHRARGFDFFMLTQHPSNLDSFVTRIIGAPGYHRHLKRVAGGSSLTSVIQWDAVNNTCEKFGSGKNAQVTMRAQPKEVYKWYDSAELHTAKLRIPKQVIYLAVSLPLIAALFYFAFTMMWKKNGVKDAAAVSAAGSPSQVGGASVDRTKPKSTVDYVADYQPRIKGLMHTAPAYDKLTEPKRVPVPAACIQSKAQGCKCYTQDATPYPVDLAMCKQLVAHGAFLAFQPEGEKRDGERREPRPQERAEIAQQGAPGFAFIGNPPSAAPALPAPAEPLPQRIASVKR